MRSSRTRARPARRAAAAAASDADRRRYSMIASDLNRVGPSLVDQSGKRHHRVDRAVLRPALRALYEVHVHHVRHEAEVERDAHAISRERTPE